MFDNSNLITAWDRNLLVGVSCSITDWVWACHLSDLAVRQEYKKEGIGRQLINLTKEKSWWRTAEEPMADLAAKLAELVAF
jgi:hypothetical protein